jgi:hypothetical protein
MPRHGGAGARARKGRLAGQHLEEHTGEAVEIAPAIQIAFSAGLLRTHVRRSTHREPPVGDVHVVSAGSRDGGGNAEIRDHRLSLLQQDVLRLDVTVDHVVPVGVSQGGRDGPGDPQRSVDRQLALAGEPVPETLAAGVRHDEVQHAIALARVVHRQDLRMGEPGRDADLAEKTLRLIRVGAVGKEYLDGHVPAVLQILRQIYRGHATATDLFLDAVSLRQGGTQARRNLSH